MMVYIVPNTTKPRAVPVALQAIDILQAAGAGVILDPMFQPVYQNDSVNYFSTSKALALCDAVITVGGDGTILHTAKQCIHQQKPILGINLGRTGFLATCEVNEMEQKLAALAKKKFQLDRRMLLSVTVDGLQQGPKTALNDVVIYKGTRLQTIDFSVYCDDILVNHCSGDGIILATPTGSTAYSLSAGGPILDTHIQGIVVSTICAHSLRQPSMVFAADRRLRIQVDTRGRNDVYLSTDGEPEQTLTNPCSVQVELLKQCIDLITFNPADQFDAIDKKLRGR